MFDRLPFHPEHWRRNSAAPLKAKIFHTAHIGFLWLFMGLIWCCVLVTDVKDNQSLWLSKNRYWTGLAFVRNVYASKQFQLHLEISVTRCFSSSFKHTCRVLWKYLFKLSMLPPRWPNDSDQAKGGTAGSPRTTSNCCSQFFIPPSQRKGIRWCRPTRRDTVNKTH